MTGVGVDRIMRRAGHDAVQTTLGYVKQAEDMMGGELGEPFAALPACVVDPSPVETGSRDLGASRRAKAVRSESVAALDDVDARRQTNPRAAARVAVDEHVAGTVSGHETGIAAAEANGTLTGSDQRLVHPAVHPAPMHAETLRRGRDSKATDDALENAAFDPRSTEVSVVNTTAPHAPNAPVSAATRQPPPEPFAVTFDPAVR